MGYGGHVHDSINRMKQNRELNRARHERREKVMEALLKKAKFPDPVSKPEKMLSDQERKELIQLLRKERRQQFVRQIIAALLAVATLILIGMYMFY